MCPYVPMPNKWKFYDVHGCRPEAREGASLTRLKVATTKYMMEERLYLFGGLSRGLMSTLSYFYTSANGILLKI